MPNKIQTLTLGLALAAAGFAGAAFVSQADANRVVAPYEHGMAFVDVFGLIDDIVKGSEYEAARTEFDAGQESQLTAMQTQMQQLQAQAEALDPNTPEGQAVQQQGMQLQQQMQQFYQQYQNGLERLVSSQIADAYKLVYNTSREEASEQGVTFLFASRPDDELLVDSLSGVAQEILARPLIAPAESIDLTAAVRDRLGLPDPSLAEEAGVNAEPTDVDAAPDAGGDASNNGEAENPVGNDPMSDDG